MAEPSDRALREAREACEPLLYQRPCTGEDIEDPGLVLSRRDLDALVERNALALDRWRREALEEAAAECARCATEASEWSRAVALKCDRRVRALADKEPSDD